jgi:hypothetical protein
MVSHRSLVKISLVRFFISKSPSYLSLGTCSIVTLPRATASLKWWYFTLMHFIHGLILGSLASSRAPELSLKALQWMMGGPDWIGIFFSLASSSRSIIGSSDQKASKIAIYSASVVLSTDSCCNLGPQMMGHQV